MSFDLIIFGGTGDLAWRKLMPALFQAFRHGSLPEGGRIIGVARDNHTNEQYRNLISARFDEVSIDKRPSTDEFERFCQLLFYQRMDLSNPQDYQALADNVKERNANVLIMYLATAPALFTKVCEQIAEAGLNGPNTRVVLEKPLGSDLASNRTINDAVSKVLNENQIFRIDHYLGKEPVIDLMDMRLLGYMEHFLNGKNIKKVEVRVLEKKLISGRGMFYDEVGALKDMGQNQIGRASCRERVSSPV